MRVLTRVRSEKNPWNYNNNCTARELSTIFRDRRKPSVIARNGGIRNSHPEMGSEAFGDPHHVRGEDTGAPGPASDHTRQYKGAEQEEEG